jgi:hypothetical protein
VRSDGKKQSKNVKEEMEWRAPASCTKECAAA